MGRGSERNVTPVDSVNVEDVMGGKREGEGSGSEGVARMGVREERSEGQTKVEEPHGPQTTGRTQRMSGFYEKRTLRSRCLRTARSRDDAHRCVMPPCVRCSFNLQGWRWAVRGWVGGGSGGGRGAGCGGSAAGGHPHPPAPSTLHTSRRPLHPTHRPLYMTPRCLYLRLPLPPRPPSQPASHHRPLYRPFPPQPFPPQLFPTPQCPSRSLHAKPRACTCPPPHHPRQPSVSRTVRRRRRAGSRRAGGKG